LPSSLNSGATTLRVGIEPVSVRGRRFPRFIFRQHKPGQDGWQTAGDYTFSVRESPDRVEHLFIVRMWREPGTPHTTWRGSVEHTETKERVYFSSLVALTAFVETCLAGAPPPARE
jgi:hypothetical protein